MRSLSIQAPAKLNLFLRVFNRRRDGFHNIQSLFERVNLFDKIKVSSREDTRLTLFSSSSQLPQASGNLAYKAARVLRRKLSIKEGVNISIVKNIPVGAGLGGGSSDAAAVILALNQLWKLKLAKKELTDIAACIGSDVPFFVKDHSFSLVTGRGQLLRQLKTDVRLWHILVVPSIVLSTKRVYGQFDKLKLAESKAKKALTTRTLTRGAKNVNMLAHLKKPNKDKKASLARLVFLLAKLRGFKNLDIDLEANYNSLEDAATFLVPQISKIKQALESLGVKYVGMSGSGSSVFGILNSKKEGEYLKKRLAKFRNWRTFVVRTF